MKENVLMNKKGQVVTGLVMIGLIGTMLAAALWIAVEVTDKRQSDTEDIIIKHIESPVPIPEPATFLMFGSGCLFWWSTRRKK